MGLTYADVELINAEDLGLARKYIISDEEVKKLHVNILVDTGSYNLCINEYDLVGPIVLKFKNRQTVCNALVLQGDNEPLLGAIPLEDMSVCLPSIRNIILA